MAPLLFERVPEVFASTTRGVRTIKLTPRYLLGLNTVCFVTVEFKLIHKTAVFQGQFFFFTKKQCHF